MLYVYIDMTMGNVNIEGFLIPLVGEVIIHWPRGMFTIFHTTKQDRYNHLCIVCTNEIWLQTFTIYMLYSVEVKEDSKGIKLRKL